MKIHGNSRGVTLVETMASVLLFLLVGASILNVCLQSSLSGKRAQEAFTAYNLAKSRIEEMRNFPFSSLSSAAETDTPINETGVADPDGTFLRTTAVTTSYTGDSSLTQVAVSVKYEIKGQSMTTPTTLTTVISQYT
jgi:Tfp pilus assembly protein PilV